MPSVLTSLIRISLSAALLLPAAVRASTLDSSNVWLARAWQSDDGLPDNVINGVAQTPEGYLWVATAGGLMRFDGARFQEFQVSNLEGVSNRVVRAMVLDRRGRLWLAMDRGPVVCVEPGTARVFTAGKALPDAQATSIAEDAEGAIWIAYVGGAVSRIKGGQAVRFGSDDGLPKADSCTLTSDTKGQLWFARAGNVGVFREGRFQSLLTLHEPAVYIGKALEGGIWICAGQRVLKYDEGAEPVPHGQLALGRERSDPRAILEDRNGGLWIGTAGSGLFHYDGSMIAKAPVSYPEITCLAEDREGNIWAGTYGGGLNRLRPCAVELLGAETGLSYQSVRSVCEDAGDRIWVTTQNGLLAQWQGGVWTTVSQGTNWPGGHAACVAADRQGGIWIGTHERGLYQWQEEIRHAWRRQDGLASDNVRSLLASATGDLWIATDSPNRLQRLHEGVLRTLDLGPRVGSIRALAEDGAANLWAGTTEGSLFRVNGDAVVNETDRAPAGPQSIRCLCATRDGSLWIGYAGAGLGRLKAGHWEQITAEQGLYDNYISQIAADDRGWLWLAGNRGIFQASLDDLADVAESQSEQVRTIVYGRGEGLPSLQANYENSPGAMRSRDGLLWFPMRTGLAVIHPESIRHNPAPPPVLLELVTVDGQVTARYDNTSPLRPAGPRGHVDLRVPGANLHLGPGHRNLEFEFTALSFTAPENVHFRYRLEGFNENWVEAGTSRRATYSRLSAGHYRFVVKACNNAGVWNDAGASLGFVVNPFFWQTWWFRLTTVGAFTVSLIAIVRYVSFRRLRLQHRLRGLEQERALERERVRLAQDLHDEIGAKLCRISYLGEHAQRSPELSVELERQIGSISDSSREVLNSLDGIVWTINPQNDALERVVTYLGHRAREYFQETGTECELDIPPQLPLYFLSSQMRHHLLLGVQEAFTNVLKHSGATRCRIAVCCEGSTLEIHVSDNGNGFALAAMESNTLGSTAVPGDGLRNMRQRLSKIGGECSVKSEPGGGTTVRFVLPLERDGVGKAAR